jgi:hypothetical protein
MGIDATDAIGTTLDVVLALAIACNESSRQAHRSR